MAKTMAGVLAVSIAALLFAGCGSSGSKLSPVQKERCKVLTERANNARPDEMRTTFGITLGQEEAFKESAALGC